MRKTVLITGVSRGIGLALAHKFLKENYKVIGLSRTAGPEDLKHINFKFFSMDLSRNDAIDKIAEVLEKSHYPIDIIINNAGIGPDLDHEYPDEVTMKDTFEVNVFGVVSLTEKIIPILNKDAVIINISSDMGSLSSCLRSDSVAYRMSKAALNMYTKVLANRYKTFFKIASLHPGWVKTAIAPSTINGRLSTEESADKIFTFTISEFETGVFWNIEDNKKSEW